MTIFAIILENMAMQGKLMIRLGVEKQVKQDLLILFAKADEFSVLRILLNALLELLAKT